VAPPQAVTACFGFVDECTISLYTPRMETKSFDILILGAGPAGLTAGMYAARAGAKTAIIEFMAAGGQVNFTPEIANYPGVIETTGAELGDKMREQAESAGAEIIYDEVTSVDFSSKTIHSSLFIIQYKSLVICMGVRPRKLEIPREEDFIGAGIHFCGLCDGAFYKGKDIIVAGGGNSAIEEALYMRDIAKSVTIVDVAPEFAAQAVLIKALDAGVSRPKAFHGYKITKILGDKKLSGIEIENVTSGEKKSIDCAGIFVAIGRTPNTALFKDKLELSKGNYIIVDDKMQTNIAGVYAAGDVTQKHVRQVITACADGASAATHAVEYLKHGDKNV